MRLGIIGVFAFWAVMVLSPASNAGEKICLTNSLNLDSVSAGTCFGEGAAAKLMDKPVKQGPNAAGPLQLTHPEDYAKKVSIRTCREFFDKREAGYYALTGADIAREGWYLRTCKTVKAIAGAKSAKRSFLKSPDTGLSDPSSISVRLLPVKGDAQRAELVKLAQAGLTLTDLMAEGEVQIITAEKHKLRLRYSEQEAVYEEMARGDFDHDGTNDMILFMGVHAKRGSMSWYDTIGLTRKRPRGLIEVVSTD